MVENEKYYPSLFIVFVLVKIKFYIKKALKLEKKVIIKKQCFFIKKILIQIFKEDKYILEFI